MNRLRWLSSRFLFLALGWAGLRAETLTIATYNIENYCATNRLIDSGYRTDYPKPEPEKRALRGVIRALNADVLVLQEMGSQPYLDELRRDLKSEGVDYPFAALASAADADRHVALLSRRPLIGVKTHTDLEFAYFGGKETVKRGLLEASVMTAGGEVTIFALHLKSRFTERPDDPLDEIRRSGEAIAIRDRVLKRFPVPAAARFLILGDCNASRVSKAVEHLQKRGKTDLAVLLSATDSRNETWTHDYRREETFSHVDHVLVSPGLLRAVEGGAARIFDGEGVRQASDHRPVAITLVFAPKK